MCSLCMLEVVDGELGLLEVEMPEVIRYVLLCMLDVLDMPEVLSCVLSTC